LSEAGGEKVIEITRLNSTAQVENFCLSSGKAKNIIS
jgi:hypothetical protein